MKKLLVIQLGGAAEVLLSTPLLRCLKKDQPELELHFLVQHAHADVLAGNPYFDHLHQLQFSVQITLHELLPQAFDNLLNLHEHPHSTEIIHSLQVPVELQRQKGFKAFFTKLWPGGAQLHPADRYLQKASASGVTNDGLGLDYFISKEAVVPYHDIPAAHHAGFIAIDVSSNPFSWPQELLHRLCLQLQHPLILIGNKVDAAFAQQLSAIDSIKIYNACGKFTPHETADLIRKSKLLVTHQPYTVQLGAALQKEMVILATNGKMTPPYYRRSFLKQQTSPPFDSIAISAKKDVKGKTSVWEKELTALMQSIKKELQPKA